MAEDKRTQGVYEHQNPREHDRWARESFTFRRMSRSDIVFLSAAVLVALVVLGMVMAA